MIKEKEQPKTKEELDTLKKEVEELNEKLRELTDEELANVAAGWSRQGPSGSCRIE